jgi:WD40 repeat protein
MACLLHVLSEQGGSIMTVHSRTGLACALLFTAVGALGASGPEKPLCEVGTHAGGVASVHYSPDGKLLVSGGGDKMIRLWDTATGKEHRTFKGSSSFTCAVRFSPDGKVLATAGYESSGTANPIYRWDLDTGKELPPLAGHPSGVRRILFTPDGKQLISGGFDGLARVWDLATGKEVRCLKAHGGGLYSLALSPDGQTLATAGRDGVRLWDMGTGNEVVRPALNGLGALALAFSPDGKVLATGGDSAVQLWEVATGKEVTALRGYKGELSYLVFSRDGRTLFTGSYDKQVRVWEVRTGKLVRAIDAHSGWVWGIALAPDERTLASCSVDTRVVTWDLAGLTRPAAASVKLSSRDLEARWADLADPDPARAYPAVYALANDPARSLPMLEKRLTAARPGTVTQGGLQKMIADLDSDEFDVREKATSDLDRAGQQARGALVRLVSNPPSLEARRRAQKLLARLDRAAVAPETLLAMRGVQALEYIGTADARRVLRRLATGAGGPRLQEEARLAVRRMSQEK